MIIIVATFCCGRFCIALTHVLALCVFNGRRALPLLHKLVGGEREGEAGYWEELMIFVFSPAC